MLEPDRTNRRHELGLAAGTTMVAIFLLIEGAWTAWVIDGLRQIDAEIVPGARLATAEDLAWVKTYLPAMYLVAAEGLLFGTIAVVGAVGLLLRKPWAHRMLVVASVLLTLTAIVAIVMAPHRWDMQVIFILFCVILWWESKKRWPV